jgi:hypothetical protein
VIGAKIFVFDPIFEHVPSGIEHRGGDRENGFFGATANFEAQELGLQVATLDADRGPGGRDQGGFEPRCPFGVRVERRSPALSSFLGTSSPRTASARHWESAMSTPISATKTCAVSSLTPGIVVSRRAHCSIGAKVFPTSASTVARACWSESMSPRCSLSKRR